jgi:hypothetical protein
MDGYSNIDNEDNDRVEGEKEAFDITSRRTYRERVVDIVHFNHGVSIAWC